MFNTNGSAECTVIDVNEKARTYTIRVRQCAGGDSPGEEAIFENVQQLSPNTTIEGDENSGVAELGATGTVQFHNNVPYISGFYNAIQENQEPPEEITSINKPDENDGLTELCSASGLKEQIQKGDQIIQTRGRCKTIWRRSGIIETEATKFCRRVMFPEGHRIYEVCHSFDFVSHALLWRSASLNLGKSAFYYAKYKDAAKPNNIVTIERGSVSDGDADVIERKIVGAPPPPIIATGAVMDPKYVRVIKRTGRVVTAVGVSGFNVTPAMSNWYHMVDNTGEVLESVNGLTWSAHVSTDGNYTMLCGKGTSVQYRSDGNVDINFLKNGKFRNRNSHVMVGQNFAQLKDEFGNKVTLENGTITIDEFMGAQIRLGQGSIKAKDMVGAYLTLQGGQVGMGNAIVDIVAILDELIGILSTTTALGFGLPLSSFLELMLLRTRLKPAVKGGA